VAGTEGIVRGRTTGRDVVAPRRHPVEAILTAIVCSRIACALKNPLALIVVDGLHQLKGNADRRSSLVIRDSSGNVSRRSQANRDVFENLIGGEIDQCSLARKDPLSVFLPDVTVLHNQDAIRSLFKIGHNESAIAIRQYLWDRQCGRRWRWSTLRVASEARQAGSSK